MAGLRGKALVAYLVVCVFWGSTYLAIRVGVGVLPPFLFAGLRFVLAGALLLGLALALGDTLPRRAVDWRTQAIVGVLLLAGGNAFVVWAEQYTPSGIASIFVVTVALWMAFFDAIIPGGAGDLNWRVVAGLLLGFLGTALLVGASPAEILRADLPMWVRRCRCSPAAPQSRWSAPRSGSGAAGTSRPAASAPSPTSWYSARSSDTPRTPTRCATPRPRSWARTPT